jgi:hypothetical protein
MAGYYDYYKRTIDQNTVGLKLVVGGTGLGKTSSIQSIVRDLPHERKAIYIANRLQLLEEMADKDKGFLLNGKHYELLGTCNHQDHAGVGAALPDLPSSPSARATWLAQASFEKLDDPAELALMRKIASYPRLLEAAALAHEPHRIAFYLYELASEFHSQWTRGTDLPHLRFIIQDDPQMTMARLALVQGVVTVLASGLALLGVGAPGEMR